MRRLFPFVVASFVCCFLLWSTNLSAQGFQQKGLVKTKGSYGSDGKIVKGEPLQGASISVAGSNTVLSAQDGYFSILLLKDVFSIKGVTKNGYALVDSDVLSRVYHQSSNPIIIVMEKPSRQAEELLSIERKIRRTLERQLHEREDEIEALKERNAITAEEYNGLMRALYVDAESNESLISQMAKRYAMIDFDQSEAFNSQFIALILEGRLTQADSLLKSKGDISERIETLNRHRAANAYAREQLEQSEQYVHHETEDIGQDCYRMHEIHKMRLQLDSSAFYLEKRADLDPDNASWQNDAGNFLYEFMGNYPEALLYFKRSKLIHEGQGESYWGALAEDYYNIGGMYFRMRDYRNAREYGKESYRLNKLAYGENHSKTAVSLVTLYLANYYSREMDRAFQEEYPAYRAFTRAIEMCENDPNPDRTVQAYIYDLFGQVLSVNRYYDRAMNQGFLPALAIRKELFGEDSFEVANSYRMIGLLYSRQSYYSLSDWWDDCAHALEYFEKALPFYEQKYGPLHPDVGMIYGKMADACLHFARNTFETRAGFDIRDYIKGAVDYYQKAIDCFTDYHRKTGIRHQDMDAVELGAQETQDLIERINAQYHEMFGS